MASAEISRTCIFRFDRDSLIFCTCLLSAVRAGLLARFLLTLSLGAKACSGGRLYLFALAAAGQAGVERALGNLRGEIERDMKLMGCRSIKELSRENLRFR